MILSYQDLDVIADSILREFKPGRITLDAIDVERLARSFLGLTIRYERLSDDFSILGATTFSPVELELLCHGKTQVISLPADTVLLEERLLLDKKQQLGRRRFTLPIRFSIGMGMPTIRHRRYKSVHTPSVISNHRRTGMNGRQMHWVRHC